MKLFQWENPSDRIWRQLTNLWTFAAMGFFLFDFFMGDKYSGYAAAVSIIYITILGIYVGTKEFDRWQDSHHSKRHGEFFIIIWTVIILFFIIIAIISGGKYRMPSEFTATYIALLSIFALTQRSKFLHNKKEQDTNQNNNQ
jgi:MFS-type transporter involved in bile tolerance (Atg22 family)